MARYISNRRVLELSYPADLYNYDIYPKVIPSGRESVITVKPLGRHAAFAPDTEYTIQICPMHEGRCKGWRERPNEFFLPVKPDGDGCLRFSFFFNGEQEYSVIITRDETAVATLAVYAVAEDLLGRYPFRGDLHVHTSYSDGRESPAVVCANFRRVGLDFMVISDHRRYYPSLEAIADFQDAPIELTIIPGEEVHLSSERHFEHFNDIHIINFGGDFSINGLIDDLAQSTEVGTAPEKRAVIPNPPPVRSRAQLTAEVEAYADKLNIPQGIERYAYAECCWIFDKIREARGLGIFCHPYWVTGGAFQVPPAFVEYMMETQPFDAFEVLGGERYFEQNGLQTIQYYEDLARGRDYPIVGATDAHVSVNNPAAHICSTIVFAPENTRDALCGSIRQKYSVAVDTISAELRCVGSMRLARYAYFLETNFFPLHDELCFEEGRAMKDHACGRPEGLEVLRAIHGRMKRQREKYFAF